MKILYIHAHFDDYEFTASGTIELWRRRLGQALTVRVLVCTDGAGGHQFRTRAETARLRHEEQLASARIGGYEFALLQLPDGRVPRETFLAREPLLLAALWKAIRDFEPDYLFCPPVPADPLAGVHVDHLDVANAVRQVAYLINVPHAFTPEYPADETRSEPRRVPVILNVHDSYQAGAVPFDLAIDVEDAFEEICRMSYCHQSQIVEWLPWVGRHHMESPRSIADWQTECRKRFHRRNRALGLDVARALEVFTVTAWGSIPTLDQLRKDFPPIFEEVCPLARLEQRLDAWRHVG